MNHDGDRAGADRSDDPRGDAGQVLLRILGPIEVATGPANLGGPKQQRVLVRLALDAPSVVSTDRLIDAVWGHRLPSKPEVTLRTYLSHLRRALAPVAEPAGLAPEQLITARAPGYVLGLEPESIDVQRFRRLAREAIGGDGDPEPTRTLAAEALALWPTGDLDGGPLAEMTLERAELEELWTAVGEAGLRAALELGAHAEIMADLRALVARDPLREEPRRLLITALYRCGRSAEALGAYEAARRTFAEELGLDLSPVLVGLDLAILRNDPDLAATTAPVPSGPARTGTRSPASPANTAGSPATVFGTPNGTPNETLHGAPNETLHGVLIGRGQELAAGREAVAGLGMGRGSIVVATGEPGIGKTTLAGAIAAEAAAAGAIVAWGHCHQAGLEATLRPWGRALQGLLDAFGDRELGQIVQGRLGELEMLVPRVTERLRAGPTSPAKRDERAVVDAVEDVLSRAAARHPFVLVFEDLHWADQATLDLVDDVSARIEHVPIMVLTTWRSTEAVADEAAARLHAIGRRADACRFDLSGLDPSGVAEFVTAAGHAFDEAELDLLGRRTAGNPLFLRELLRSPASQPSATVREAIDLRLGALDPGVLRPLEVAALSRRPVHADTIATAAGDDPAAVEAAFSEAERAGIMTRHDDEHDTTWAFAHDLIADRLARRCSPRDRARRHAALARAIEPLDVPAEAVAHHYSSGAAAGTAEQGAHWSRVAARESIELHDHRTAERLLHRALDLLGEEPSELRADVLLDLAQVAKFLARYTDAHRWSAESFAVASEIDDLDRMCQAALVYAGHVRAETNRYGTQWLGYWNPAGPSIAMLETCLERADDDGVADALTLSLVAQLFGEFADTERSHAEGLAALDRVRDRGDDNLLTDGLFGLHTALQRSLSATERAAMLDELDAVAARTGLTERRLDACRARYLAALDRGDRAEAERQIARARSFAAHSDDYLIKVQHRTMQISDLTLTGRLPEALELVERSFDEFARIGFTSLEVFGIQYAALQRELGALDVVIGLLGDREGGYPGPAYGLPLAAVLLEAGRSEEAERVFRSYDPAEILAAGEGVLQFTMPAFAADLAIAFGDPLVEPLFEALRPARNRIVAMFDGLVMRGSGSLHLGRLATAAGRLDEADELLAEARDHHQRIGAWPQVMRTELAAAELDAARTGGRRLDGPHLDEARELAASFAMTWLVDRRIAQYDR